MKKFIATACTAAVLLLAASAHAEKKTCVRAYGKTAEEAFRAGAKLAEREDAKNGGRNCLNASTQIHILPEKLDGLYVAEVHSSPRKGSCELPPGVKVADAGELPSQQK